MIRDTRADTLTGRVSATARVVLGTLDTLRGAQRDSLRACDFWQFVETFDPVAETYFSDPQWLCVLSSGRPDDVHRPVVYVTLTAHGSHLYARAGDVTWTAELDSGVTLGVLAGAAALLTVPNANPRA